VVGGRQGKGVEVRGHHLPSPPCFLSNCIYVFWLSVSIREVASEYPFYVLIYMNSFKSHIYFLYLNFYMLDDIISQHIWIFWLSPNGERVAKYGHTHILR